MPLAQPPGRSSDDSRRTARRSTSTHEGHAGWDKAAVAELSALAISRMSREELISVISVAQASLPQPGAKDRLGDYDRNLLERLAYLARRCCRNQGY